MSARLATHVEVGGLIRRVEACGGSAMVLARGDREAGAILLILMERGVPHRVLERRLRADGTYGWDSAGPQHLVSSPDLNDYIGRRRSIDSDLWVVELDVAEVQRFGAELVREG